MVLDENWSCQNTKKRDQTGNQILDLSISGDESPITMAEFGLSNKKQPIIATIAANKKTPGAAFAAPSESSVPKLSELFAEKLAQ